MAGISLKPNVRIRPTIYCYTTPGVTYHDGWVKIGYTEKQTPYERILQHTHTADVKFNIEWRGNAQFNDDKGDWFTDHDFHKYLVVEKEIERIANTEWFHIPAKTAREYFNDFADRRSIYDTEEHYDYVLRKEQQEAVEKTKSYFEQGGTEFLWNAKPRFGKTLSAYDLVLRMGFQKVLVVTNRPSIANSWAEDFRKFIGWRGGLCFVSELDSIRGKKGVRTRKAYLAECNLDEEVNGQMPGFIEFESLQNLKGSLYFGGSYDKLEWLVDKHIMPDGSTREGLTFDLLIVDESHEGVDTLRTDKAFRHIKRKHTLYLSGTPFKALANNQFREEQIFNWTYADEQEAKEQWDAEEFNPYERLPRLEMYTYQLSSMIYDELKLGADVSDEGTIDYAFDLNEFFSTNDNGRFIHEEEIKKFLHALTTQEKYPFSTPELRKELAHTLWLLNRVASAKALAALLKKDPVFKDYEIVLAAGDGVMEIDDDGGDPETIASNEKAFDRVKKAIAEKDKTITLSVGQLTVGVTIPEWSGVLMLCNTKSPSTYMQAAFRAQNPCMFTRTGEDGKPETLRKETAYVFDFDPARTLIIFDEFANNLSPDTAAGRGTSEERRAKIRRLLNFFPVLGEDNEGEMVELDAAQVLSIPRRLKSVEVVRRGFMSNYLFQNISNVFGAPNIVQEIVNSLTPAKEEKPKNRQENLSGLSDVTLDENGDVEVKNEVVIGKAKELFGEKVYAKMSDELQPALDSVLNSSRDTIEETVRNYVNKVKETVRDAVVAPVVEDYEATRSMRSRVEKKVNQDIERTFGALQDEFIQQKKVAAAELAKQQKAAQTEEQVKQAEDTFQKTMASIHTDFAAAMQAAVNDTIQNKPVEVVENMERAKRESQRQKMEDEVRDHLRGFSRTVPSFIMAYGDEKLRLANFDDYTEDDVFLEVTGITEDQFRFLRDGGDYTNAETGQTEHFAGQLFDETVFDDSIQEFLRKRMELADYFAEAHPEDIFDYIPPQKTNQIFTPRWVVKKMVDHLEEENPGCFDDPDNTFADLYMKSGLYITEIVKRLFNSEGIKKAFPDDRERIQHIMNKQVYGMAPTRIIYLIATNYILGFDETLKLDTKNFVQGDAAEAAKSGTLQQLVDEKFGGRISAEDGEGAPQA